MDFISTRVRGRARTVAVVAALALVPTGGTAVAAPASVTAPSIPVVTITMKGANAKVAGASKLAAGWVRVKVSTDSTARNLWFYTPKAKAKAADVGKAEKAVRKVRAGHGQGPAIDTRGSATPQDPQLDKGASSSEKAAAAARREAESAQAESAARRAAADAATAEKSILALGGVYVGPKGSQSVVLNLPKGQVTVVDLAAAKQGDADPLTVLTVGAPAKTGDPGKADGTVFLDESSRIQAPEKLPRAGELLITNQSVSKWHFIGLQKLAKGATENDVVAWFDSPGAKRKYPFDPKHSVAAAPLSGGYSQYLRYDLPAGKYALVDAWVDPDTGRFFASQGGTRLVTLK